MKHVWWRSHLRKLPERPFLQKIGNFNEVDEYMPFLAEALDLPTRGRVVELGCARGSFSVRLAQWGYRVAGVEEAAALLELAAEAAARNDVELELRQGDFRQITERREFDGALMLDFGAGSDAENAEMMRTVAGSLRFGGRLVFVTCNPYYWCREARAEHLTMGGADLIRRFRFDFETGSLISRVRCILAQGERRELPEARYRAYTVPELRHLVLSTGLADLRIYGEDDSGRPRPDLPLDNLRTPFFHSVALRPVTGESGEGI
jgi:2-polyprenyl-3-methyl-5-hydroxy-6-metoxy-1,4-benzoquinol methylase